MTEIIQILFLYLVFTITIFLPINIFSKNLYFKNFVSIDLATFNLGINLSILLFFSFLNYPIEIIQPALMLIYLILFIFVYFKNSKIFIKTFVGFIPIFLVFFILSLDVANKLYLGWDAKFFYYIKSLYFFENKTFLKCQSSL